MVLGERYLWEHASISIQRIRITSLPSGGTELVKVQVGSKTECDSGRRNGIRKDHSVHRIAGGSLERRRLSSAFGCGAVIHARKLAARI